MDTNEMSDLTVSDLLVVSDLKKEIEKSVAGESARIKSHIVGRAVRDCFRIRSSEKVARVLGTSEDDLLNLQEGGEGSCELEETVERLLPFSLRCSASFKALEEMTTIKGTDKGTIRDLIGTAGRKHITSVVEGGDRMEEIIDAFVHGATPEVIRALIDNYPILRAAVRVVLKDTDIPLVLRCILGV